MKESTDYIDLWHALCVKSINVGSWNTNTRDFRVDAVLKCQQAFSNSGVDIICIGQMLGKSTVLNRCYAAAKAN